MDLLLQADPSIEMIEKYLYSGDCFLALLNNETIGTFVLQPNSVNEIEVKNISIDPKFQGQGIGKDILKYVVRISKLEGYESLIVKTADVNKEVIEFYKKNKFQYYFTVKSHYLKYYDKPIYENGVQAVDQIVLKLDL